MLYYLTSYLSTLGERESEESKCEESENEESESEFRHSQRDLVAQEMGVMNQVSHSSSVSTFCRSEIKDRNHKSIQHPFLFQEKNGWPRYALCHFVGNFPQPP